MSYFKLSKTKAKVVYNENLRQDFFQIKNNMKKFLNS